MKPIRFGSVCSGIEAASVAWEPLGWKAAWFSEIEPFPSAVLAHHYPEVPNLGDMTALPQRIANFEIEAPDILCGGTPCQAFSVAGLRKSLGDARGNLSLTFCEIANAIDTARQLNGQQPCIIFWENVPGILNTSDNAFGCFLAGLAGEGVPLQPAGGRWTNAGVVLGPKRAVAWRVLDAQYFGVAQRRRRVFVVASARDGFDPATVLFEFDGVRRDTAPSREAGQTTAACLDARTKGGGFPGTDGAAGGHVVPYTAQCLTTDTGQRYDPESETIIPHAVTQSLRGEGFDASEDGTGRGTPLVPVHCRDVAQTITSNYGKQVDNSDTALGPNVVAFDTTQITSPQNGSNPQPGDPCHPLAAGAHAPAIIFHPTQDPISSAGVCHSIGVMTPAMQVRRLTPVECERLQGFPDGYTAIPWRKKPASECPDGPRYKALGNSWAVPNVRWIGQRIHAHLKPTMAIEYKEAA